MCAARTERTKGAGCYTIWKDAQEKGAALGSFFLSLCCSDGESSRSASSTLSVVIYILVIYLG